MLLNGSYPTYLKERILSPRGHQSNDVCAQVVERVYHEGLQNIWLCHLSPENNTPESAYETVAQALLNMGIMPGADVYLKALDRLEASPIYPLNEAPSQPRFIVKKEQQTIEEDEEQ